MESFLARCLDSVVSQTFQNIEIIIVDDASRDRSVEIIQSYATRDRRIRLIRHDLNKGTFVARINGVSQARGRYVVFLDPDDFYTTNQSLLMLWHFSELEKVDILQFSIKMVVADDPQTLNPANWLQVKPTVVRGSANILHHFFWNSDTNAHLWNKIFRTAICKKAFSQLPETYLICASDTPAFFTICYFAKTFKARKTDPIISYSVGSGISTRAGELRKFSNQIEGRHTAWKIIKDFLVKNKAYNKYLDLYTSANTSLTNRFLRWFDSLNQADAQKGFPLLYRYLPHHRIVTFFYLNYKNSTRALMSKIGKALPSAKKDNSFRTFGVLCTGVSLTEIKRFLSVLPGLREYIIFVDSQVVRQVQKGDHHLYIPLSQIPAERNRVIAESIQDFQIKCIINVSPFTVLTLFDLLLVKLEMVPAIQYLGELCPRCNTTEMELIKTCYDSQLIQRVVYGTPAEKTYLERMNISGLYIPRAVFTIRRKQLIIVNLNYSDSRSITLLSELTSVLPDYGTKIEFVIPTCDRERKHLDEFPTSRPQDHITVTTIPEDVETLLSFLEEALLVINICSDNSTWISRMALLNSIPVLDIYGQSFSSVIQFLNELAEQLNATALPFIQESFNRKDYSELQQMWDNTIHTLGLSNADGTAITTQSLIPKGILEN